MMVEFFMGLALLVLYAGLVIVGIFFERYLALSKYYENKLEEEKSKTQPINITRVISKVDGEEFITITTTKVEQKDDEEA